MVQAKSICLRARKMGCLDRGGGTGEAREPLGSPFLDLSCHFQKYKVGQTVQKLQVIWFYLGLLHNGTPGLLQVNYFLTSNYSRVS